MPNQFNPVLYATEIMLSGATIIPAKMPSKKSDGKWEDFQTRLISAAEIKAKFATTPNGYALICGAGSGNVEVLDIDLKYDTTGTLYHDFCAMLEEFAPGLTERVVVQKTINNGFHFIYRCPIIEGNRKIAANENGKVVIETRGQGGFVICAPTEGYEVVCGSLKDIPTITPDERAVLLDCAAAFHVVTEKDAVDTPVTTNNGTSYSLTPGNDFIARGDIRHLLTDYGWRLVYVRQETEYWRRPGKNESVSATFNFNGCNKFYVFSSNAAPFDHGRAYNKFAVYTLLKFGRLAFSESARELAAQGYGDKRSSAPKEPKASKESAKKTTHTPHPTNFNEAEAYISSNYELRFNAVTGETENYENGKWTPLSDRQFAIMYRALCAAEIKITESKLKILIESDFVPEYNPVKNYLDSLPDYDGGDHIGDLARTVKTQTKHWELYLSRWLVADYATKIGVTENQTMLVLAGGQGIGKSKWLNRLCPEDLSPEYVYIGTIDPKSKDSELHISTKWLINVDELETMNKHEVGVFKAIISKPHVKMRKAWGRFDRNYTRLASFCGSVNKDHFLTDETGNRRFLVALCDSIDYTNEIDMRKVHSHAKWLFEQGFRYWFNREEIAILNNENESYVMTNMAADMLDAFFEPPCEWGKATTKLTATQIANRIAELSKVQCNRAFVYDVAAALKKMGFVGKNWNNRHVFAIKERILQRTDAKNDEVKW